MAVYVCSKCLFCFERTSEVETCPDCGNKNVRYATNDEKNEYRRNKAEFENFGKDYARAIG